VAIVGSRFLDRYRVLRPIGRGAAATVYLAFDAHGTPFALKVFPRRLAARAEREWLIGRGFDHPNVNPVLERGWIAGQPALLLAYAPGSRLSEWRLRRPSAPFLPLFRQLLEALAHVHEKGYVHRDVKPENLIVAPTGRIRLVDFDLAGPNEEGLGGLRVGTLAYLAPEVAAGKPATPAADLYSAGVLLYWGLFGELPFTGNKQEVLAAHRHTLPEPPAGKEIDPELWFFLQSLLAKHPADRLQDAAEALDYLPEPK